ncbi:hypothetical protein BH23VER1_BH23VER1_37350 [soil metagenome]
MVVLGIALVGAVVTTLKEAGLLPAIALVKPLTPEQKAEGLARAARSGDLGEALLLLGSQTRADAPLGRGVTPLMLAALNGHDEVVSGLLRHGASANATDADGFSPLSYAIGNEQLTTTLLLLEAGSHPGVEAVPGEPAIVFATRMGDAETVAALLAAGGATLFGGSDALLLALQSSDPALAHQLLKAGIDPAALTVRPGDPHPLDLAAGRDDLPTVSMLLEAAGAELVKSADPLLVDRALLRGKIGLAKALLGAGLRISADGETLAAVVEAGDREAVALLLAHGAEPGTLMASAIRADDWAMAELLLDHGADPDAYADGAEPALFAAARTARAEFVHKLLAAGASTTLPGLEGQPPLALAVATRDNAFADLLLKSGADPDIRLPAPPSEAFLELLGEGKLGFYLQRDSAFTPLMIAAGTKNHEAIKILLAHGASKGTTTQSWKRYPINLAAENKDIYGQQLLLNRDPETEDPAQQRRLVIDLSNQKVTLFQGREVMMTSRVSSGKKGHETPTGEYVVSNKHRHWTSTLYDASMPYFMRFSCGDFGLHQGNVPSYPASHGCIRMPAADARKFYSAVKVGDPVSIVP